jgi:flagellar motility protein MotE (MotC chaperone)
VEDSRDCPLKARLETVKDNTTATLKPWTEEDETKLEEMEKENIDIKDTELGRERKQKHNELIVAAPSMSPSTKAKLMKLVVNK